MNITSNQWRYSAVSVIGTSHQETGLPCQDACQVQVEDDRLIAAVADGAGSAKYADTGASFIVENALTLVQKQVDFEQIVPIVRTKLEEKAVEMDCRLSDLAATFLLVAVSPNSLTGIQIGDGAVVYNTDDSSKFNLLSLPERGEYLNETTFLTSPDYLENIKIVQVEKPIRQIALFSDGLQLLALNLTTEPPIPHQPFFEPLFTFLKNVDSSIEREQTLIQFLQSERVCARTNDDKTLILINLL